MNMRNACDRTMGVMTATADRIPGHLVQAARKLRGWTQTQLAEAIGAPSRRTVVSMEGSAGVPPAWRRAVEEELGAELAQLRDGTPKLMTGEELREAREEAGFSRETFAELLGVSAVTLAGWESSRGVPARRVSAIERALRGEADDSFVEKVAPVAEPVEQSIDEILAALSQSERQLGLGAFSTAELAEEIARRAREGS